MHCNLLELHFMLIIIYIELLVLFQIAWLAIWLQREKRISIMGSAVANYLRNYLDDGTEVGIVSFSSAATVLAEMTKILNDTTREELIAAVPTTAGGGTSIGAGMEKCAEVKEIPVAGLTSSKILDL